jgi:hypothetical protein
MPVQNRDCLISIKGIMKGNIFWKVGPNYSASPVFRKPGQMAGPHHVHMIPKGLPGEGNTMITEGADGHIFEVTHECTFVWEYVNPIFGIKYKNYNSVCRAHRFPANGSHN